jgi:LuxR family maltose regulon positive regulatory protein
MLERPDWLVRTKLHPPLLHADTIERHRLLETLRTALTTRPVTLISAPAGYGKTTLLASLPRLMPEWGLAWLSLDAEDNDPPRFLAALIGALQRLHPAVGAGASEQLAAEPRHVIALLINELMTTLPGPIALVLDDLHLITEPRLYAALDFLIERLPPQMRLVIATRHDPPLALARLMARRQIAEVRRPHLSFTADEVSRLLNDSLGLALGPDELAALTARTEGWPAGLCLLASSLDRITTEAGRSALLTDLAQTDRYVFDFLATEVLDRQEPAMRTFLLQSSILPELTPALCAAVTGEAESGRVLEELYRKNLFLVVDESGAYRYHALFTEFLRRQLAVEQPDRLPELHRRAALAQPTPTRAIDHYLAAGLYAEAARTIERVGPELLLRGLSATLHRWGQAIPDGVKADHPWLCFILGRSLLLLGDYPAAATIIEQARAGFARVGDPVNQAIALSALCSCAMLMRDVEACRPLLAQFFALPDLPGATRARGLASLAWLQTHDQDWEGAAGALREALELAGADVASMIAISHLLGPWAATLPGCLEPLERFCAAAEAKALARTAGLSLVLADIRSGVELLRGRLESAAASAKGCLALKEQIGEYAWLGLASAMTLTTITAARGDLAEANRSLASLLRLLKGATDQIQLWLYVAGRTAWLLGRPAEARQLLERMQASGGFPMGPALQRRLAGLLALGEHRLAQAEEAFRAAVALEERCPIALAAGSSRVLLVRALLAQQREAEALAELRRLLELCARSGMVGLLVQEGALILPLLQREAPTNEVAARVVALLGAAQVGSAPETSAAGPAGDISPVQGVDTSPAQAAGPARMARAPLAEPLTERELEVLRFVAAGATNREIASALIIGEETVKTHVARILRKLEVPTRAGAGARARELGLL